MTGNALLRLRGRFAPHPVVLCYHRVAALESDPQLLAVDPERFDRQMEILCREAVAVPLRDLVSRLLRGLPLGRRVAVTFDDGYADNLEIAKPILEKYAVPATVFVVAGMVDSRREFWWDELERLLLLSPPPAKPLDLTIGGHVVTWDPPRGEVAEPPRTDRVAWTVEEDRDPSPAHTLYRKLVTCFRSASPGAQETAIDRLRDWAGRDETPRYTHRTMGSDELRRLADGGLVRVGSHGLAHVDFSGLSSVHRRRQMVESKMLLERAAGALVDEFAYPFGTTAELPDNDAANLAGVGYRLACANVRGTVSTATDPFRLPRFVARDWSAEEFARRLRRWFGYRASSPPSARIREES